MSKNMAGLLAAAALAATMATASAATTTVVINAISENGVGKSLGSVKLEDSEHGLVLIADLDGLAPGKHGVHVHEYGSCAQQDRDGMVVAGLAAGGYYDPDKAAKREGRMGQSDRGDQPLLVVTSNGTAKARLIAPRLRLSDAQGRALIIHEGGDNHSDTRHPLRAERVACGVVK